MFAIPTLKESVERVRRSFRSHLPGSDAWIWPNNINPTGKVFAGLIHEVFGFADYIQRQKFAVTAPDSESLDLHGEEYGLTRRPASPARFTVTITCAAPISVQVSAQFLRADGVTYIATAGGSLPGAGTLDVEVIAATNGRNTTPAAGTPLDITFGVTGDDDATAVVSDAAGAIVPGDDIEDDETFRARILFRKRNPPHGGSAADYVLWCGEVPGVSFDVDRPTVFVERRWAGAGTVRVFPLMFDLYADGIPGGADVQRVSDYLETVIPAGVSIAVVAPTPVPVSITISGLSPDRVDVREAVTAELRGAFRRLSRVAGGDSEIPGMPYLAYPTTFSRSWIWQAVANATGEERHSITAPSADIALGAGQMATLGTISFV